MHGLGATGSSNGQTSEETPGAARVVDPDLSFSGHSLLSTLPVPVMVTDTNGHVTHWNEAAERTFGWSAGEVLGRLLPISLVGDTIVWSDLLGRFSRGEQCHNLCFCCLRKDGSELKVRAYLSPLQTEGRFQGVVAVACDASAENRRLEGLIHELRHPLAAAKGLVSLLSRWVTGNQPGERVVEVAELLKYEIERLAGLVEHTLRAGLTAGFLSSESREPVSLHWLVQRVIPKFAYQGPTVRYHCSEAAGPAQVFGNPLCLELVVRNVLRNAVKYSPAESHIEVEVTVTGEFVQLTVRDQGIGVPAHQLEEVFLPRVRAQNAARKDPSGQGLGLWICREVTREHGGRIWIESVEGRGTTVRVELPRLL